MSGDHLASDRVRQHTAEDALQQIDAAARARLARYAQAPRAEVDARLRELDDEWDIERVLMVNAATLAGIGVLLGFFVSRWWLLLPLVVLTFLVQHALQGWCPPLAVFRRLGKRTRREIDAERTALKALAGDFEGTEAPLAPPGEKARRAYERAST